jgi:hypothetical protein
MEGKPLEKRPPGGDVQEDVGNIKMAGRETGCEYVYSTHKIPKVAFSGDNDRTLSYVTKYFLTS